MIEEPEEFVENSFRFSALKNREENHVLRKVNVTVVICVENPRKRLLIEFWSCIPEDVLFHFLYFCRILCRKYCRNDLPEDGPRYPGVRKVLCEGLVSLADLL